MKTALKENIVIPTRDFVRNFPHISDKPTSQSYTVIKHGRVVGTFTPNLDRAITRDTDEDWWKSLEQITPPAEPDQKRISLKDLEKYRFRSGEKHLSQRIDEIVYGIKR